MMIHTVIQQRRRELRLTQEQVADCLGVTTPAVNKWEKGSSCPDIALLPPLARLLKTDLNTLFGFYEDITQQEVIRFCNEVNEITLTEGVDAGFAAAEQRIREYPNSDMLLYNFALQLQFLLATAGLEEEQANAYLKRIDAWYERLTQSEEEVIRNGVNFIAARSGRASTARRRHISTGCRAATIYPTRRCCRWTFIWPKITPGRRQRCWNGCCWGR